MKLAFLYMSALLITGLLGCSFSAPQDHQASSSGAEAAAAAAFATWANVMMNGSRERRTTAASELYDAVQSTNRTAHDKALRSGATHFFVRLTVIGTDTKKEFDEKCSVVEVLIGDYRVARANDDLVCRNKFRHALKALVGVPFYDYQIYEEWKDKLRKRQKWNIPEK